jgi:hypothetical protein
MKAALIYGSRRVYECVLCQAIVRWLQSPRAQLMMAALSGWDEAAEREDEAIAQPSPWTLG